MEFDESCDAFEDDSNDFDGLPFEIFSMPRDDDWAGRGSDEEGRDTGGDAFALEGFGLESTKVVNRN